MTDIDIGAELERIGQESYQTGDVGKQAELINLTFTLLGARLSAPFKDIKTGEDKQSYIATVDMGDGNAVDYWLDGHALRGQLEWLMNSELLPRRVKLIQNPDLKGNPYWLQHIKDGATLSPAAKPQVNYVLLAVGTVGEERVLEAAIAEDVADALAYGGDGDLMIKPDAPLMLQAKAKALVKRLAEPIPFEDA